MIVGGGLSAADLGAAKAEPRILFHLAERNLPSVDGRRLGGGRGNGRDGGDRRPIFPVVSQKRGLKTDWSVSLGAGNVAPNMFPAKYSFNINATPSCALDYAVFGLNVADSTSQANLVGLTNLYSGSAPRLCNNNNPTVNWAYNGSTAGGAILTSPVLSLDGSRIAYVESAAGKTIFHVLDWKAGEGTSATAAVAPTLSALLALAQLPASGP